jgi:predicted AlkP superfamily phosphohydrolase/phosphomutase
MTEKPRLMMIGLDGATFDVIRPLVAQGRLPVLGRLMAEGAHGTLESIVPPITGPAWSVLATGKNPGQLGAYDFLNRRAPDDFNLYPIRSHDLAGQTFWDLLTAAGYRVGILNYPMLTPAYPLEKGWMVGGLGASTLHDFTHPAELKQELDTVTGGYEITISYGLPKYRDNLPRLVAEMKEMLRKRLVALEYLLSTRPVDALVVVFMISDIASHTLWRYWADPDPADPEHAAMREAYISIWEALDDAVGQVLAYLSEDGHALIISDHGFGDSHGVLHVNQWLAEAGYLVRHRSTASTSNQLREWLVQLTTPFLGSFYRWLIGSKIQQMLRSSILREIDLEQSRAFVLDSSDGGGGIYINRLYARRNGLDEEHFVQETMAQLQRELPAWGKQKDLDIQLYRSDEIYQGEKAVLAPELTLSVNNYRCSVSYRFAQPIYADRPHHPMKSGNHRRNGILLATGPAVAAGQIRDALLQDIAPTLLYLAEVPIPVNVDGRVLTELLQSDQSVADPVSSAQAGLATATVGAGEDEEDMSVVLQRLADLGYLD